MIRSWLGHASIETKNNYVEIDLEDETQDAAVLREIPSEKGKARPIMRAQQRHSVMAGEAVVMCSS